MQTDICLLVPRFELPAGVGWLRHWAVPMSEAGMARHHLTRSEAQSSSAAAQKLRLALDAAPVPASPAAAASLAWILTGFHHLSSFLTSPASPAPPGCEADPLSAGSLPLDPPCTISQLIISLLRKSPKGTLVGPSARQGSTSSACVA